VKGGGRGEVLVVRRGNNGQAQPAEGKEAKCGLDGDEWGNIRRASQRQAVRYKEASDEQYKEARVSIDSPEEQGKIKIIVNESAAR